MKRRMVFSSIIISVVLMITSCGSQKCTCACCTTQTGCRAVSQVAESNAPKEDETMDEEVEDSCENPVGPVHYPYVEFISEGSVGSISITTLEHGDKVYDIRYNTIFTGLVKWTGHKCYATAEKATKNPITINSREHEMIVTLTYENNSESFTLKTGDSQLLSISHSNFPSTAYVYVIVT